MTTPIFSGGGVGGAIDKASELEKTVLDQMSFEGNDVNFSATLTFQPEFLKLPKQ